MFWPRLLRNAQSRPSNRFSALESTEKEKTSDRVIGILRSLVVGGQLHMLFKPRPAGNYSGTADYCRTQSSDRGRTPAAASAIPDQGAAPAGDIAHELGITNHPMSAYLWGSIRAGAALTHLHV